MKKYKKIINNFIKSSCFLVGLLLVFLALSHVFERKDGIYVYDSAAVRTKEAEVDAEETDTIDVIFLGDSVCYSSFNPLQIYAEYGYTSFVCGTSAQRLCDSYAILQSALVNQKPQVVVLETNCLYRDIHGKKESGDQVLSALSERFAVFENHSRWKDMAARLAGKQSGESARMRGFVARRTIKAYEDGAYMQESGDVCLLDEEVLDYLNKIEALCKEEGAKFVLVSVPSPKKWNYEKHNGVVAWATEHEVPYKDLNLEDDVAIDWATDTKDGGDHLNLTGATKVSHYIGEWMQAKYALPDNRDNPSYERWKEDSLAFESEN